MSYHSSQHQAAGGTPTDARRDKRDTNLSPFEFVRGCERVGNRVYCISMREARGAEATREVVWWDRTRGREITKPNETYHVRLLSPVPHLFISNLLSKQQHGRGHRLALQNRAAARN